MSDALAGLDLEALEWQDLALCNGWDHNQFFDDYESSETVARSVDDACLSCPVMKQCLQYAVEHGETGCWGGVYLVGGKPDKNRNAHKTPEVWEEIRKRIGKSL